MKKLTKEHIQKRVALVEELSEKMGAVNTLIQKLNAEIALQWEDIESAKEAYNQTIQEANALQEEIASDIDNYVGERSEKWQEGEQASRYEDWKGQWEESFDECDLDEPEALQELEDTFSEDLENRPEELP